MQSQAGHSDDGLGKCNIFAYYKMDIIIWERKYHKTYQTSKTKTIALLEWEYKKR